MGMIRLPVETVQIPNKLSLAEIIGIEDIQGIFSIHLRCNKPGILLSIRLYFQHSFVIQELCFIQNYNNAESHVAFCLEGKRRKIGVQDVRNVKSNVPRKDVSVDGTDNVIHKVTGKDISVDDTDDVAVKLTVKNLRVDDTDDVTSKKIGKDEDVSDDGHDNVTSKATGKDKDDSVNEVNSTSKETKNFGSLKAGVITNVKSEKEEDYDVDVTIEDGTSVWIERYAESIMMERDVQSELKGHEKDIYRKDSESMVKENEMKLKIEGNDMKDYESTLTERDVVLKMTRNVGSRVKEKDDKFSVTENVVESKERKSKVRENDLELFLTKIDLKSVVTENDTASEMGEKDVSKVRENGVVSKRRKHVSEVERAYAEANVKESDVRAKLIENDIKSNFEEKTVANVREKGVKLDVAWKYMKEFQSCAGDNIELKFIHASSQIFMTEKVIDPLSNAISPVSSSRHHGNMNVLHSNGCAMSDNLDTESLRSQIRELRKETVDSNKEVVPLHHYNIGNYGNVSIKDETSVDNTYLRPCSMNDSRSSNIDIGPKRNDTFYFNLSDDCDDDQSLKSTENNVLEQEQQDQQRHVESLTRYLPQESTSIRTSVPRKVVCSTEKHDMLRMLMHLGMNHGSVPKDVYKMQPVLGKINGNDEVVSTKHVDADLSPLEAIISSCLTSHHQPSRNEQLCVFHCHKTISRGIIDDMHNNVKTDADAENLYCDYRYEWIRYISFQEYPETSSMFPSVLARDGWWYSGRPRRSSDEVTCFECNKKHSNWNKGDNARQHHAHSCRFLRGTSSNVPIHDRNLTTLEAACVQESTTALTEMNRSVVAQTSSAGLSDLCSSQECTTIPESTDQRTCHQTHDNSNEDSERRSDDMIRNQNSNINFQHQNEDKNTGINNVESLSQRYNDTTSTSQAGAAARSSYEDNTSENVASGQDTGNKLKYSAYDSMDKRTKSFQGWPAGKTQTPKDMALAGMFYAGYEDYVRCHCCGVGLRNWDNGDDPWVEHARWSPTCDYVIRTRGKKFVDLIQRKAKEKETERSASATNRDESAHSAKESEMQSLAIKYIKDMGYCEDKITTALTEMKKRLGPGRHKVTAHDLMEIILQQSQEAAASGNQAILENTATTRNLPSTENKPTSTDRRSPDALSKENTSKHEGDQRNILQDHKELTEQLTCKICMERSVAITFIPCGHLACCEQCSKKVMRCPICRARIKEKHKTYLT